MGRCGMHVRAFPGRPPRAPVVRLGPHGGSRRYGGARLRRFAQMMWRLNFLVFFACVVLDNSYMLYYICPMHTLFTVMVCAVLAIAPKLNHSNTACLAKYVHAATRPTHTARRCASQPTPRSREPCPLSAPSRDVGRGLCGGAKHAAQRLPVRRGVPPQDRAVLRGGVHPVGHQARVLRHMVALQGGHGLQRPTQADAGPAARCGPAPPPASAAAPSADTLCCVTTTYLGHPPAQSGTSAHRWTATCGSTACCVPTCTRR